MSAVRSSKPAARSLARVRACGLLLLTAAACNAQDPSRGIAQDAIDEAFDFNGYVCDAMPVLVRRCASLACHGSPQHALRVYAPGKLRAGDITDRDAREAPLTIAEINGNFASSTGVLRAASADQRRALELEVLPLLRAPLSRAFGGDSHHGLAIFPVFCRDGVVSA